MRLTNVALIDLPVGRVGSYAPVEDFAPSALSPLPLPVSFDQGRHVGEGDRPGSWMAIAIRLDAATTDAALATAWDQIVARHGSLHSAFSRTDDGAVALHEIALIPGVWEEHPALPGEQTRHVVRRVFDHLCRPFARPSHRMLVVRPAADAPDPRLVVIVGSDHSHVDMWSLQVLVRDLITVLEGSAQLLPPAPAFAAHTAQLLAQPPAPPAIAERWADVLAAGGGRMPVFPLPLGDLTTPRPEVVEVHDLLDLAGLHLLEAQAAEAGVRVIALAMSKLTAVTAELAGAPLRAVFPVHSRFDPSWHHAVGWFITNAVLECDDADPAACAASIRRALALGSTPLAPIFGPAGMPSAPGMFAISWLDTRRLPVQLDPALEVQHMSAVIPTDGVMAWFIAGDDGLHLRVRYPETPEARVSLGRFVALLIAAFRVR